MDKNSFKDISLNGRVAYAISCFENLLLSLNYNSVMWNDVLKYLWEFTSIQNLEEWNDKIAEIIPENLLEFNSYEEDDFEYIDKDTFKKLYELYQNIDTKVEFIIRQIFYIGSSHSYSRIDGCGQNSLDQLDILIEFMRSNSISLPDIKPFLKYSIKENKGWGNDFDGSKLSKIL